MLVVKYFYCNCIVCDFNLTVSIRECDDYDMTSHVEEEEEADEEAVRRKKTKRNFDDYVLGMLL